MLGFKQRSQAAWAKLGLSARVITLRSRSDRALHVDQAAHAAGMPYTLFQVDRHPSGGTRGCFESHVSLCREALSRGDRAMLVLEDDFDPTSEFLNSEQGLEALEELVHFVTTRRDWDLMFLGVLPNIWTANSERVGRRVYKLAPWACTHAYIISEPYMRIVAHWTFKQDGPDAIDWRFRSCPRAYAVHPQIFKQYDSPSDIRSLQLPAPAFLRDLPVNAASWYALHVGASLAQTAVVVWAAAVMLSLARSTAGQHKSLARAALTRGLT